MVVQQPADDPGVVVAEGGAARGHGGLHPGQVAGHHVGVALDDHGLAGARDLAAGQVDAVEHVALLVDRGLGGVEVLRLDAVVVEDPPRTEPDRVAAAVADGPHQPPPEPVVEAAVALAGEPARDQLLVGEALLAQVLVQVLSPAGRETDPEVRRRHPRRSRAGRGTGAPAGPREWRACSAYHSAVTLCGLDQARPLRAGARSRGSALLVAQLDAVLLGQALDGLAEAQPVHLHDELDDVAASSAAEAVVDASRRG